MSSLFRYIEPIPEDRATGLVSEVYRQVNTEFSSIGPAVMMISPAAELLAAVWALLRESLVAGTVARWRKETVTVSVSALNRCAYDLAGHSIFLRIAGGEAVADALLRGEDPTDPKVAAIVQWARATATPDSPYPAPMPFDTAEAPEYIGSALALHFINRLVTVILGSELRPGAMTDTEPRAFDGAPIARAIAQQRIAGESLRLLERPATTAIPRWAGNSPVGTALATLREVIDPRAAGLSDTAAAKVRVTVTRHHGRELSADRRWLEVSALSPDDRAGSVLAILTALTPHFVTEGDIAAWRTTEQSDERLLMLLGFGALTAVDVIEAQIADGFRPRPS